MAAKDLRTIVAELAKVDPGQVGPAFSLEGPAFAGSLKKAVLVASIRRSLGVDCMRAALARTFAELEAMVQAPAAGETVRPAPAELPMPQTAASPAGGLRCGIDLELVGALPQAQDYRTHEFYVQNFTEAERAYCAAQSDPRMHLAARWAAKEALRKCDPGMGAWPFNDVEVVREASGSVFFQKLAPQGAERLPHAVSLTHTAQLAAAVVVLPAKRSWFPWA
ncbi:MAG: 4'-phosphopantetheinyl transferase superfamily protein [Elusimicrobia bacterium]|jgi:holo-[acyl-carrier protein] synthase|nr:4'-phosphopantetheinyl transferase superfamily protein [Elusimicrobiota bacterium]